MPSGRTIGVCTPWTSFWYAMTQKIQSVQMLYTCSAKRRLMASAAAVRSASSWLSRMISRFSSMTSSWMRPKFRAI